MSTTSIMEQLETKAALNSKKVIYPEGEEKSILEAAIYAEEKGIAEPILIGERKKIEINAEELQVSLDNITVIPPAGEEEIKKLAAEYVRMGGALSEKGISRRLKKSLYYGAMLVKTGVADTMVAGLTHSTADVILAGQVVIGLKEGITIPSSIFLMEVPGFKGPEGELIIFADGGVCEMPGSTELADIAITSAETTCKLLDWTPRIAMLSFSTKGSVEHEVIEKSLEAVELVRERRPELAIDGEFQLDAAIIPEVAAKKVPGDSPVAGKANILIFPDLGAGNIAYKAVQRFAGGNAYGPFLQGFAKTISDLSRGSSVRDIIGVTTMAVLCAAEN